MVVNTIVDASHVAQPWVGRWAVQGRTVGGTGWGGGQYLAKQWAVQGETVSGGGRYLAGRWAVHGGMVGGTTP